MTVLRIVLKCLLMLAFVFLAAVPFLLGHAEYRRDVRNRISHRRFRMAVAALIYVIAVSIALTVIRYTVGWVWATPVLTWLTAHLPVNPQVTYAAEVLGVILLNAVIGLLFRLVVKLVRIGMKKKLTEPGKKGKFSLAQKIGRKVVRAFYSETWFFVGRVLTVLNAVLFALYGILFFCHQIPVFFSASRIPYAFLSDLFEAGYRYPVLTLLVTWEASRFFAGIRHAEEECPELFEDPKTVGSRLPELDQIDEAVRAEFGDRYLCSVDMSVCAGVNAAELDYSNVTKLIGDAVNADPRNPKEAERVYMNCLETVIGSGKNVLINGSLFSDFSAYFLRYLSIIVARGDNVLFVCSSDEQCRRVCDYVKEGLTQLSSLYRVGFTDEKVNLEDPIWRIIRISGSDSSQEDAAIADHSIVVSTLDYFTSFRFENNNGSFIRLLDMVVFTDTVDTLNIFRDQIALLNAKLCNIAQNNAEQAKNKRTNPDYKVRYMARPVRYVCFDDTGTSGVDKILKNLLQAEFVSADALYYRPQTLIRCYSYEGKPDADGKYRSRQYLDTDEDLGTVLNMAYFCLSKGAGNVTVFIDGRVPLENYAETLSSHQAQTKIQANATTIRLNAPFGNADRYRVVIAMDTDDNLPAAVRKYASMMSEKPTLIMIFSGKYMLRDYYAAHIDELWRGTQLGLIPACEITQREIEQEILTRANAGGIFEEEVFRLASGIPAYAEAVRLHGIDAILRGIVRSVLSDPKNEKGREREKETEYHPEDYFEFTPVRDFDEAGRYRSGNRITLRRKSQLYELVNGRGAAILSAGGKRFALDTPRERITQNYIEGQNLLCGGLLYRIDRIDRASGLIVGRHVTGGKNDEACRYIQSREYRVDLTPDKLRELKRVDHVRIGTEKDGIRIEDAVIDLFRAPTEVLTKGYTEISPVTLSVRTDREAYHYIDDPGMDAAAKHVYRRYGDVEEPYYTTEEILETGEFEAWKQGAKMLSVRLKGDFGPAPDKTAALAAFMMGETLRLRFPYAQDVIVVCPVLHAPLQGEDAERVKHRLPGLTLLHPEGTFNGDGLEFLVIEDSASDPGVLSVLTTDGGDILKTLFAPVFRYLNWILKEGGTDDSLCFGTDHVPDCMDPGTLLTVADSLGSGEHDHLYVNEDPTDVFEECDFCGRQYRKGENVLVLEDGRIMCRDCASKLVGNDKNELRRLLERAKLFMETTYGITLDDEYEFCFDSTAKILKALKQSKGVSRRGGDTVFRSYVDENKKVHIEYSLPAANLSELLARELTHVWQIKNLPSLEGELAEGHVSLVGIQYLRYLGHDRLANTRTHILETSTGTSGTGYRRLVSELVRNPEYRNDPFRYLLEKHGNGETPAPVIPTPVRIAEGLLGARYVPGKPDRVKGGKPAEFWRSRFPERLQPYYDSIRDAMLGFEDSVSVPGLSNEDGHRIQQAIRADHPELFYVQNYSFGTVGGVIRFGYCVPRTEAELLTRRIEEAADAYLREIDDSMSAYDVELRLHVKMITEVDYDSVALKKEEEENGPDPKKIDRLRSLCGVFLDRKAVCAGYAHAMVYLLRKCGIESAYVRGNVIRNGRNVGGHAWIIVKADGEYYYTDTTWDDSSNTVQAVKLTDIGLAYFNITTAELLEERNTDGNPCDPPPCTATKANYFVHNGLLLESYDKAKLGEILAAAAKAGMTTAYVKFTQPAAQKTCLDRLDSGSEDGRDVVKAMAKQNGKVEYLFAKPGSFHTVEFTIKYK